MSILYIMSGCPGSGKTTWANEFMKMHPDVRYVSRDEIRFSMLREDEDYFAHETEVFNKFVGTIAATLIDGFDVIADATHISIASRAKLHNALQKKHLNDNDYEIIFVFMNTSISNCIEYNDKRRGRSYVSHSVLRRMHCQTTMPSKNEFSNVKEVWVISNGNLLRQ